MYREPVFSTKSFCLWLPIVACLIGVCWGVWQCDTFWNFLNQPQFQTRNTAIPSFHSVIDLPLGQKFDGFEEVPTFHDDDTDIETQIHSRLARPNEACNVRHYVKFNGRVLIIQEHPEPNLYIPATPVPKPLPLEKGE